MTVSRAARTVSAALLLGWGAAVVAIAISRAAGAGPNANSLASTPRGVWDGDLWPLLSSSLPVARLQAAEIAGVAVTLALAWRAVGPTVLAVAALAAHVGSALIVYAGIGLIHLVSPAAVSDVLDRHDYGISAVWYAALGTLVAVLQQRGSPGAVYLAAGAAVLGLAVAPFAGPLAPPEHVLSLAIGWAVARHALRGTHVMSNRRRHSH